MTGLEILSDEQVAEKVRAGDREAFSVIIERYEAKLSRYVARLTGNAVMASDVAQDTFVKAYENLNGFNTKLKFSSWIYRIAHNEAINAAKAHHREAPMPEDFDAADEDGETESEHQAEVKEQVEKCLDRMPFIYSEPLILFYLEEKSYDEISDILRLPVSTVGTRMRRGRAIMKKICQKI